MRCACPAPWATASVLALAAAELVAAELVAAGLLAAGLGVAARAAAGLAAGVQATTVVAAMAARIVARDALWFFVKFIMQMTLRMVNDQRQRASARHGLGDNPPHRTSRS